VTCKDCNSDLKPVTFLEEERSSTGWKTGRLRTAVSHLICENCGHQEAIDDSMDMPWRERTMVK
jgi:hypothetical protein